MDRQYEIWISSEKKHKIEYALLISQGDFVPPAMLINLGCNRIMLLLTYPDVSLTFWQPK